MTIIGIILTALITEFAADQGYSSLSVALRSDRFWLSSRTCSRGGDSQSRTETSRSAPLPVRGGQRNNRHPRSVGRHQHRSDEIHLECLPPAGGRWAVGMTEHPNLLGYSGAVTGAVAMAFVSSAEDRRSQHLAGYMLVPSWPASSRLVPGRRSSACSSVGSPYGDTDPGGERDA